jgi:uncharacterized membrane protein
VSMSFPDCCGPSISLDIIIYFHLLHNQGGRFKIVSTIGHVLCVLLFKKGFMSSVLIVILIFLRSMVNLRFRESMFYHYVASTGCLIIPASCLCFSLCHRNNSDSLFANQCFKRGMIEMYQNTFLGPSISVSVVVLIITTIFSMIESIESTNRAFLEVFVLRYTI